MRYTNRPGLLKVIRKYLAGQATPEETAFLENYYQIHEHEPGFTGQLEVGEKELLETEMERNIWSLIDRQPKVKRLWPRIAAAASLILVGSAIGYQVFRSKTVQFEPEALLPAMTGITLTTSSGKVISIAYHHRGQLNSQVRQTDSLLAYQGNNGTAEMQTLTNNSGHKLTVQLADGSETILDVASALTYPSAFTGRERRVSLNGQAYFKVKHNAQQPFYVDYQNQTTEDIGTEFNIYAFTGEPAATTLISGRVRVGNQTLQPGEQFLNGRIRLANIEEVTGWLQDRLIFHKESLENIMNSVARIYKVQVVWQDEASRKLTFGGSVNRSKKLANVLDFMRRTGKVDFRVEGKTVYIIKPINK